MEQDMIQLAVFFPPKEKEYYEFIFNTFATGPPESKVIINETLGNYQYFC